MSKRLTTRLVGTTLGDVEVIEVFAERHKCFWYIGYHKHCGSLERGVYIQLTSKQTGDDLYTIYYDGVCYNNKIPEHIPKWVFDLRDALGLGSTDNLDY